MPRVDKYIVSLTDDDGTTTNYITYTTTFNSDDEEYPINLVVGKDYNVVVHSVNGVGNSEGVNDTFGMYSILIIINVNYNCICQKIFLTNNILLKFFFLIL